MLNKKANNKELQWQIAEAEMVLKTFEVRDLKHLLEENGHDPMPFVNPYIDEFMKYQAAIDLVMDQVKENEDEKKVESEISEKVQKEIRRYNKAMNRTQIEVNRMSDENNKG
jgi:hypothetical protein